MKWLYCALLITASALLVLALEYFPLPSKGVDLEPLARYFSQIVIWGIGCGGAVGATFAFFADRVVRARPREDPASYQARVALHGVLSGVLATLLVVVLALHVASIQSAWQLTAEDRVSLVLHAGRFIAVPAAAVFGSLGAFLIVTRARSWNGRRWLI